MATSGWFRGEEMWRSGEGHWPWEAMEEADAGGFALATGGSADPKRLKGQCDESGSSWEEDRGDN